MAHTNKHDNLHMASLTYSQIAVLALQPQAKLLHDFWSDTTPSHGTFKHARVRVCMPPPHVCEHADQLDHGLQLAKAGPERASRAPALVINLSLILVENVWFEITTRWQRYNQKDYCQWSMAHYRLAP
jgi:hypothetical protein